MIRRVVSSIQVILNCVGALAAGLLIFLVAVLAYNVIARYAFSASSIGLEELSWHLYASVFLLGIPYAFTQGSHVRVDLFFDGFSDRKKAIVDIVGCLICLIPFCWIVIVSGWQFASDAWGFGERPSELYALFIQVVTEGVGEKSQDPGGLVNRWFIKGVIPLSFFLLFLAGIAHILNQFEKLSELKKIKSMESPL